MKNNKIKITRTDVFYSHISLGLEKGYTQEKITKNKVVKSIQEFQDELIEKLDVYLSAKVTECDIVMSGQVEPHLTISFINYPKFPLEIITLKTYVEKLGMKLMSDFNQNRIVIEHSDETIMLEKEDFIDSRISKKNNENKFSEVACILLSSSLNDIISIQIKKEEKYFLVNIIDEYENDFEVYNNIFSNQLSLNDIFEVISKFTLKGESISYLEQILKLNKINQIELLKDFIEVKSELYPNLNSLLIKHLSKRI